MNSSTLSNRDRRRKAASSRRAARDSELSDGGSSYDDARRTQTHGPLEPPTPQRQPMSTSLLSSLSQALSNIDKHNNSYFSSAGVGSRSIDDGSSYDTETITFSSPHKRSSTSHTIHNHSERKSKYSKLPPPPTQFSSYIKFNRPSLHCLLIFTACYLLVLICFYPMISYSNVDVLPTDDDYVKGGKHHIKKGASFQHVRGRNQFMKAKHAVTDELGTLKERALIWEEEAKNKAKRGAVEIQETEKEIIDSIAGGTVGRKDGQDAIRASSLLEEAVNGFDKIRLDIEKEEDKKSAALTANVGGHDHWKDSVEAWDKGFIENHRPDVQQADAHANSGKTPGFMVLGMHRSGTSMLSGLLVKGFGYETGGPLIGASVSFTCTYRLHDIILFLIK